MLSFTNSFLFRLFCILYYKLFGSQSSWKKILEIRQNIWSLITYFRILNPWICSLYIISFFSFKIFCIVVNVLLQYTRSTNYFWMFNESFYLHLLLLTVFKEQNSLNVYYFIGWGEFQFLILKLKNFSWLIFKNF